jgi:8-oxo-dGTP pyrophosphatase MutT (NUDIX family)
MSCLFQRYIICYDDQMSGKYPDAHYRVSTKAIIRNGQGEVLVVKENGSAWSLPGGGMDHGEDLHAALARELYEETLITAPFTEQFVGTEHLYLERKETWLLWLVFEINIEAPFEFGIGQDADDVAFINPESLKDSDVRSEQLVYKFTVEQATRTPSFIA